MGIFEIKKILMPTDFSETAEIAMKQAVFMARISKADLKLLYVMPPVLKFHGGIPVPQGEAYYNKERKFALGKLKAIAAEIKRKQLINIKYDVQFGVAHKEICATAKKENVDLVVMGTHGISGINEFFAGSNAYKVVAGADCPVITFQKKTGKKAFKKIILPIRLEKASRQKVDYVVELAKLYASTVFITGFADHNDKSEIATVKKYVQQVEKYLNKLNINCRSTLTTGENFTKEMLGFAKKNKADLIAIMNDNDFSLDQLIKGPYAKQFVNHSSIPIMSVPVYSDPDLAYSPYLSGSLPGM